MNRWKYWRAAEVVKRFPEHYKKYLFEWQHKPPQPVHYIEKPQTLRRNIVTGEIKRRENRPLPLIFPKECHEGMWGGEGIIKGFQKRHPKKRRVPHFWVPILKEGIFYSEILNKTFKIICTDRTYAQVAKAYGFDFYILKTHPVDLRSQLAMDIRRTMLLALIRKELYPDDQKKQHEIYEKYKEFIIPEEEAEWFGLSVPDAIEKQLAIESQEMKPIPLKVFFRQELIEELKREKEKEMSAKDQKDSPKHSWISNWNPFQKAT